MELDSRFTKNTDCPQAHTFARFPTTTNTKPFEFFKTQVLLSLEWLLVIPLHLSFQYDQKLPNHCLAQPSQQ